MKLKDIKTGKEYEQSYFGCYVRYEPDDAAMSDLSSEKNSNAKQAETGPLPAMGLNGSDPGKVSEDLRAAGNALYAALDAVAATAPHGRDFSSDDLRKASAAHHARLTAIQAVLDEISELYEHAQNKLDERENRYTRKSSTVEEARRLLALAERTLEAAAPKPKGPDMKAVKRWMMQELRNHIDDVGEVDATGLAEAAALKFDLYEDKRDYRPIEDLFDMAAELAIAHS